MAQAALSTGSISYDADKKVTNVEFTVSPIEKSGMTGYLTAFSIEGTSLEGEDLDGDGYYDEFKGEVPGELELGQVYSASIDMKASSYTHSGYALDIMFTAAE